MSEFKVVSDFQPTGDQPQAIEKLVAGLRAGHKHQTLLGATGTGKLDYARYMRCLRDYCPVPYMILEYFQNRDELLRARDIIRQHL